MDVSSNTMNMAVNIANLYVIIFNNNIYVHTHTHTHTHIYIYMYIIKYIGFFDPAQIYVFF